MVRHVAAAAAATVCWPPNSIALSPNRNMDRLDILPASLMRTRLTSLGADKIGIAILIRSVKVPNASKLIHTRTQGAPEPDMAIVVVYCRYGCWACNNPSAAPPTVCARNRMLFSPVHGLFQVFSPGSFAGDSKRLSQSSVGKVDGARGFAVTVLLLQS